ncbi:hypothetical protein [Corallococcus llansteffanensis]|uniref:Uncharacterized protein n=1 Tax=Corallococcus llansteffanensis TaxID=2316731 RepID=A0A3A8NFZ5_9BACT|nr:hypothetical protein [Corallococcus llansteffanensis]RKH42290.1 hypothetical protein D7V93_37975 [Corallococcus llansteffanensis]
MRTPSRLLAVAGLLLSAACSSSRPAPTGANAPDAGFHQVPATGLEGCLLYTDGKKTGAVPKQVPELSGLAASQRHPGIFWGHNDSNNAFELFALDETGAVKATLTLTGADPRDIEDVAVGPCAPGEKATCVFLADTGDNFERRKEVRLFRFAEPATVANATLPVEALPFTYVDGPHDAESLILDARSGRIAVLTKTRASLGDLYEVEGLKPGGTGKATKLGTLRVPEDVDRLSTGAALHPSGERLLVRTYTRVWEVRRKDAKRLEDLIQGQVVEVPGASQAQAEAITFLQDGRGYLLGSEFTGEPLVRVDCR